MSRQEFEVETTAPLLPAIGCLTLLLVTFFMCLMPFVLVDMMHTALSRLHLSAPAATLALAGIFAGSLFNIPVRRIDRGSPQPQLLYGPMMVGLFSDRFRRMSTDTIVAVNVGGCVVPVLLALWQVPYLIGAGGAVVGAMVLVTLGNIAVCSLVARPVPGIGIMMPGFVSPLTAVTLTWLLLDPASAQRAPVAFVAGVLGPLAGADLLHLKDIRRVSTGLVSIGGAGTFDGIVLSGVLAALLS